ncbi:hypothetical protein [Kitasatospora viridis]|uniref:Uncharacterized protein n=1 Tax=Kitasatospora viridis TaxID=281105 RepID=A0A561UDU3_9ACTN|nr:hypothetical protein [Kitasatospora viridis]TWF97524.1 hypothetical protein FHX73_111305 [Kitasatospora viridis]
MTENTASDQINAVAAAMALLASNPDLPAPALSIENLFYSPEGRFLGWGLHLALHHGLHQFELWRQALDINPADVTDREPEGGVYWLRAYGTFGGVPVRLIGCPA